VSVISVSKNTQSYKDLIVWQKAVELAVIIYKTTNDFPKHQQYSLVNQIERSAVSVASNIAEGAGRKGLNEFVYHVGVARGSLYELQTQILIANKVTFISNETLELITNEIEEIGKMLNGLKRSLEGNINTNN